MALANTIRRTASRVVPLAIRASSGCQRYRHHRSALFEAVKTHGDFSRKSFPKSFSVSIHQYSTKRASSYESLRRVIDSEIQLSQASEDDKEGVAGLHIFKNEKSVPGQQTATLTREFRGETICVEIRIPDLGVNNNNNNNNNEDNNDNDEERRGPQWSVPLVVRVSKMNGPCLQFGCTAYPDEIAIHSLSVKEPESSADQIAYEGPDFTDLDENLQKAFHKYLEIRGVKPGPICYHRRLMILDIRLKNFADNFVYRK